MTKLHPDILKDLNVEVIFLTHNEKLHEFNLQEFAAYEKFIWQPDIQINKQSLNNKTNVRYKDKYKYIEQFKQLFYSYFSDANIRYIF